jgi:signal-transduction protein with cAMP-binding, CBS, and nucleotidyltransferase domain
VEPQNTATQSPSVRDGAALENLIAALPIAAYSADEAVLTAGSKSGCLFFLKSGAVGIFKDSIEIATVKEPGAVLGEISALLDRTHTATFERWRIHSFISLMRRSSGKTQSRYFTLRGFWRGVLLLPMRALSN